MPQISKIYLIRHGETSWSLTGQHTSRTEIALTANGEKQASALGERLRKLSFTQVLTSPRLRAQSTYELSKLGISASVDNDLAEWDYGDFEGLRTQDIQKTNPHWNLWTDGCPNGEGPDDVSARADRLIQRLRSMTGNVAVFSHGHFCCALAARWIHLPIQCGQHFSLAPASLSALGFLEHHQAIPAVLLWNSTSEP